MNMEGQRWMTVKSSQVQYLQEGERGLGYPHGASFIPLCAHHAATDLRRILIDLVIKSCVELSRTRRTCRMTLCGTPPPPPFIEDGFKYRRASVCVCVIAKLLYYYMTLTLLALWWHRRRLQQLNLACYCFWFSYNPSLLEIFFPEDAIYQ